MEKVEELISCCAWDSIAIHIVPSGASKLPLTAALRTSSYKIHWTKSFRLHFCLFESSVLKHRIKHFAESKKSIAVAHSQRMQKLHHEIFKQQAGNISQIEWVSTLNVYAYLSTCVYVSDIKPCYAIQRALLIDQCHPKPKCKTPKAFNCDIHRRSTHICGGCH